MSTRPADYFLLQPARVVALKRELESWRGTPFRKNSAVKGPGGGVDCANYIAACFIDSGAVGVALAVPAYDVNHAEYSADSQLRDWFESPAVRTRVRRLDEDEVNVDGDFVFPKVGLCEHHIGVRIGQLVYHVTRGCGWSRATVSQLVLERSRYRLMEARA